MGGKKSYPSVNAGLMKTKINTPATGPGPYLPGPKAKHPTSFKQNCFRQSDFRAPTGSLHRDVKGTIYAFSRQKK